MTAIKRKIQGSASIDDKRARVKELVKANDEPIPVTVLSGFLGSGKTTLLKHILTSKEHGLKIAVIVNDMSELNIDGQTISTVKTKKEVVTLENGCICCTLRGDLIREINNIQKLQKFDYVLIESTGVAEPQQVAESFCVDPDTETIAPNPEQMLWNVARLDTCVTVVDVVNFSRYLSSLDRFKDVFQDGLDDSEEAKAEGAKSISELMVEQVEFANVILLNKIDLVSKEKIEVTKKLVKVLNPKARVIEGSFGKVDLLNILNTNLFNMQEASESPGWLLSLQEGLNAAHGEDEEYGVSSFIYRARKPFHPLRLHAFVKHFFCFAEDWAASSKDVRTHDSKQLREQYGSILRSKGTCWIAGRDPHVIGWAQAGRLLELNPESAWYCVVPEEEWEGVETEDDRVAIKDKFIGEYGDRCQEIVFIGTEMNHDAIKEQLTKCLLTDEEMLHHSPTLPMGSYPDPLTPIGLGLTGSHSLFMIARHGQNQHIRVYPGSSLTLQNIAVTFADEDYEENIRAIKVWLDKSDVVERGVLLATLRPQKYEQHATSVTILPCDEETEHKITYRRIRVEIIPRKGVKKSADEWLTACEVHIIGKIKPLPYEENVVGSDIDDEEGMACSEEGGVCPL